jgi:hypothetical protein
VLVRFVHAPGVECDFPGSDGGVSEREHSEKQAVSEITGTCRFFATGRHPSLEALN